MSSHVRVRSMFLRAGTASLLATAICLTSTTAADAQPPVPQVIRLGADRPLGAGSQYPEVEPHVTANPRNPRHLVAASITVVSPTFDPSDCSVFASFDGGVSWSAATRLSSVGHRSAHCGDPWTTILPDGTALVSVLGDSGIAIFRSPDGGRTWPAPPVQLRGAYDHEMIVVDTVSGAAYVVSGVSTRNSEGERRFAVSVVRSADGGKSFHERGRQIFSNLNYEAQTPVVFSDGALMVPYMDHHDASNRRLQRRRVWATTSSDSGLTFSEPALVSEACNRRGPAAWPSFAVAPPGTEHVNRLYFVCEAHENRGILFASSADRGDRWTETRRVDSAGPSALVDSATWTKNPAVAVSAAGVVALTWYDRRDDPDRRCQHLYATISIDGGTSFLPPTRISDAPSCPDQGSNGDVAGRFPGGGDYSGLVPVGPREFLAVWADSRSGRFQLRTARLCAGVRQP